MTDVVAVPVAPHVAPTPVPAPVVHPQHTVSVAPVAVSPKSTVAAPTVKKYALKLSGKPLMLAIYKGSPIEVVEVS